MLTVIETSIASRAIDALKDENSRVEVQETLLEYLDTDTIWLVGLSWLYMRNKLTPSLASTKIIHHNLNDCRPSIGTLYLHGCRKALTSR
jgi:ATP12 chaperone protein